MQQQHTDIDDLARGFPHDDADLAALATPTSLARLISERHRFTGLTERERLASAIGLRDLYFLARAHPEELEHAEQVKALAALFPARGQFELDGLELSFHPTQAHKSLRFIEQRLVPPIWRRFFARPCEQMPELMAVFADPQEFHYRTFENIVPLDRLFDPVSLSLQPQEDGEFIGELFTLRLDANEETRATLNQLDALDLYLPPLNEASRGGKRFIFHCARLADELKRALEGALPEPWRDGFAHVNPVFRLNRFEPGDAPFASHIDTPYRDPCRGHISRCTLVLYLSGGSASPVLRVADTTLDEIEPMTCALFDQVHEHEGFPFEEGSKLFLRTELIYTTDEVIEAPWLGAMFAKACYLSSECLFADELAPFMHDAYDRVAAARWDANGEKPTADDEIFVHKEFEGLSFISNGHDFWFDAREVDLCEAATFALLDFFNCKIDGEVFGKRCSRAVLNRPTHSAWIPGFLDARRQETALGRTGEIDKRRLFPAPEEPDEDIVFKERIPDYQSWRDYGDMTRCEVVIDLFIERQKAAWSELEHAAIMMMGQEIFLDREHFLIEQDRIYVMTEKPLRPVHFAAMSWWEVEPEDFISTEVCVEAPFLLVPPILYRRHGQCIHLIFDFFRNSWMVSTRERSIEIPSLQR
jgi:hypothetical protein